MRRSFLQGQQHLLVPEKWMAFLSQSAFKRDDDRSIIWYLDILDLDEIGAPFIKIPQLCGPIGCHSPMIPSQVFVNAWEVHAMKRAFVLARCTAEMNNGHKIATCREWATVQSDGKDNYSVTIHICYMLYIFPPCARWIIYNHPTNWIRCGEKIGQGSQWRRHEVK